MLDALETLKATAKTPRAGHATSAEQALAAAKDYEAVFISDAFKTMYEGVDADPMGGGSASLTWRELLVDEYAKGLVARGGIGLAAPIARELLSIQEANAP